jgi:hypothetical protein
MYKRFAVVAVAAATLVSPAAFAKETCVKKAGEGWGLTRGMAEFQSFEIIQQVTGNWPIQSDKISKPVYSCKGGEVGWTCIARATVCKKA